MSYRQDLVNESIGSGSEGRAVSPLIQPPWYDRVQPASAPANFGRGLTGKRPFSEYKTTTISKANSTLGFLRRAA